MKKELQRALFNPWNLLIVLIVEIFMFANAYFDGWNTSLGALNASDILNMDDRIYYAQYYGNTFRVWFSAYSTLGVFAPILLVLPYILTYREEISNNFRYLMIARKGKVRYSMTKLFSIVISGVSILVISEFIFYGVSFFFTYPLQTPEFLDNIVRYNESFFLSHPYQYFFFIIALRVIYYFCLSVFSVGVTSFIESKIAIILTPFLLVTILDSVLPSHLAPYVMIRPNGYDNFSIGNFAIVNISFFIIGITFYMINEKKMSEFG